MQKELKRYLFSALMVLGIVAGFSGKGFSQMTVGPGNAFYANDVININAPGIFPVANNFNFVLFTGSAGTYQFDRGVYGGYTGTNNDDIDFVVPDTIPCGTYDLSVSVMGAVFGPVQIEIRDSVVMTYPVTDSVFCVGENGSAAIIAPGSKVGYLRFYTDPFVPGLILDESSGLIGVHSGSVGDHLILVETIGDSACAARDTFPMSIKALTPGELTYPNTPLCPKIDSVVKPIWAGQPVGGSFSFQPVGINWADQDSGWVDAVNSDPGTYLLSLQAAADSCYDLTSDTIVILPVESAIFDYAASYCVGDGFAIPTITSLPPGQFNILTFPPSNIVDPQTGAVDLSQVTTTATQVRFIPSSTCSEITTDVFGLEGPPDGSFNYLADTLCGSMPILPVVTDTASSVIFIDSAGVFPGFDPNTGELTPVSAPAGGPYVIQHVVEDPVTTCRDTFDLFVWVSNLGATSIQYPGSNYCQSGSVSPTVTSGQLVGFFGSIPSMGTALDSTTGTITLSDAPAGTYDIFYIQDIGSCQSSITVAPSFVIDSLFEAEFNFSDTVCTNSGDYPLTSTVAGLPMGGTETFQLFINGVDQVAAIDNNSDTLFSAGLPAGGPYPVVMTVTNGMCTDTTTQFLRILPEFDASFDYLDDEYCSNSDDPRPFISGDPGGTFFSNGPITFVNDTTGEINLDSSITTVPVAIFYMVGPSVCADTAIDSVTISASAAADFSYPAPLEYCSYDDPLLPINELDTSGTYVSNIVGGGPETLIIDASSGELTFAGSDPGIYQITHTLTSGTCDLTFQLLVTLRDADAQVTIDYPDSTFCRTDSIARPMVTPQGGLSTGFFLGINGITFQDTLGTINLVASTPGPYEIEFTTTGDCPIQSRDSVIIQEYVNPAFSYPQGFYCTTDSNPMPLQVDATAMGTFIMQDDSFRTVSYIDPSTGEVFLDSVQSNTESPFVISFTPNSTCTQTAQEMLVISLGPDSTSFEVEPGDIICKDQEASFLAQGGDQYTFFINGTPIPSDSAILEGAFRLVTDQLIDSTLIEVDIQNSSSCRERRSILMRVVTLPIMEFIQTPTTISSGQVSTLLAFSDTDSTFFDWEVSGIGDVSFAPSAGTEGPRTPAFAQEDINSTVSLADETSPAQIFFSVTPRLDINPLVQCRGTTLFDTVLVNPLNEAIFIPEVITPNGDNMNDTWQIQWREDIIEANYTMILFNRSGGAILEMSPLNAVWNGDDNPDGVYWWKLINNVTGDTERTGGLTIIRREQ